MKPLEGVRVLDLTHVLAGPFCTFQLAVLGADVIKIEAPDRPDMTRVEGVVPELNAAHYGTYFLAQNGGKRALALDLTTEAGKQVMRDLVNGADVLVQNYAGDVLARLGFGAEDCHAINPRLIYCQLTGFGRTGPKASDTAYDIVVQAYSGIMAGNVSHPDGPQRVGPPMVDYGTGAQAALAVVAAVLQRERTGKGQVIDVSMLDSAMMLMSAMVTDCLTDGKRPEPHGNAHAKYAGYRTFETADGLLMVGCYTNDQLARLLDHLGEPARATEVRATPRAEIAAAIEKDAALLQKHFLARPAVEWEHRLNAVHVPAARVRHLDEALAEAQIKARAGIQPVPGASDVSGPRSLPVAGFSFAHGGPSLDRAPPQVGEQSDEILAELGYSDEKIGALRSEKVIT
ncbi:MAG: CaiB/BaiF CoA-transferase family protein [Pseudomonadota bacterium]